MSRQPNTISRCPAGRLLLAAVSIGAVLAAGCDRSDPAPVIAQVGNATLTVDAQGRFETQLRPGEYVIKLVSVEGDALTSRKFSVKRNRMTRIEIDY